MTEITNRALIFGASGQDGAYLSRLLLEKGYEVHGTSREAGPTSISNLDRLGVGDRVLMHSSTPTELHSVAKVIERTEPKEIYNLCGPSSVALSFSQPEETLKAITLGAQNILQTIHANDISIRFYNAASSECFGDTGDCPANEQTPFNPRSPYAEAKVETFRQTAEYRENFGLFACSGILFNHESPLRPEHFVTRKIISGAARIATGGAATLRLGNLDIRRDWGWAPEYVDAMWRMLQQERPDDYVIATGEAHSLEDLADAAFSHYGLYWRDHVKSDPALLRPNDIAISAGDAAKAHKSLGWKAKTCFSDIIRLMAESEITTEAD